MSSLSVGESCEFYDVDVTAHDMAMEVAAVRVGMALLHICNTHTRTHTPLLLREINAWTSSRRRTFSSIKIEEEKKREKR